MQNKQLARQLVQRMESLRRAGVTLLPKSAYQPPPTATRQLGATGGSQRVVSPPPKGYSLSPASRSASASPETSAAAAIHDAKEELMAKRDAAARSTTTALAGKTLLPPSEGASQGASGEDSLEKIRREVAVCTKCRELACTRTQTVFGVGNPQARLCFLGEAPGADEDRQGEPFVGRAGQLLNKIIEACTLRREDVYILNILKCRPPGNRNPEPQEAANCRPFLDRQLALIKPEFICCLGAVAARNLLNTETSIGKLRGRVMDYNAAKVVCTYHPAYLLRNPAAKRDTWEDMQMLMKLMGVELPK